MSDNTITKEDVRKVADLSSLELTDAEVEEFSKLLTDTLAYMDVINELDTSDVTETYQVTELSNVYQDGSVVNSLPVADVLQNANDDIDGHFGTEAVFDRE
jgi:aspartyl-tRNA(Asn)/glutamyl-tRNA(Gln) amidotransferase subunit C